MCNINSIRGSFTFQGERNNFFCKEGDYSEKNKGREDDGVIHMYNFRVNTSSRFVEQVWEE